MSNLESGVQKAESTPKPLIRREHIPYEVAIWFQNKLSHVMAPDLIRPYLSHDDPQTELEIAYANKWMHKYADPEGTYNGFQSFCDSSNTEYVVKDRLMKNTFTEDDLQVAKQFIEAERRPLFTDSAEEQEFLNQFLH